MADPSNQDLKDILLTTGEDLQKLIHEETAYALFCLRKTYFESEDKAGKMLVYRLKQLENKQTIPAFRDESGKLQCKPNTIDESFKKYYTMLCSLANKGTESEIDTFLKGLLSLK